MLDIGFAELILLAGLGLIVLGPQRLPKAAAQLGRWIGQARRMSRTLMYQLRQEVNLDAPKPFANARPPNSRSGGGRGAKAGLSEEKQKEKDDKPRGNSAEPQKTGSEEPQKDE